MGKKNDAFTTSITLLKIIKMIPKQGKISSKEVHERLLASGIQQDKRSTERQLKQVIEHFDIERDDRSKPYGYRWLPESQGFTLPQLTPQESLLLLLAEQQLQGLLPANLMHAMHGFFDQAKKNLDNHIQQQSQPTLEKQWLSKVRVVANRQPLIAPNIDTAVFEAVSNALYANMWLKLTYQNASGELSEPTVMPLGLAQQAERLYLVCRYQGYDNERTLAMHRIQSATVSTLDFQRPEGFDLSQYDDDGRFLYGEGEQIHLSFKIKPSAGYFLKETPLSQDQTLEEEDHQLIITATVIDSLALTWWLRGFGDDIWDIQKSTSEGVPRK